MKAKTITYVESNFVDDSFKYIVFNANKLYVANSECIKIVSLKIASRASAGLGYGQKPVIRKVNIKNVSTIQLYSEETRIGNKIHGLALTSDGFKTESNSKDFIHVMIEIEN